MGLTPVPAGHCAAIVTHLEMRERPQPRQATESGLRLEHWPQPDLARYRALFARVGTPWLWFSRAVMPDRSVAAIIGNPAVEIFAVTDTQGNAVGILELDFRDLPNCEIGYFGLIPELNGSGKGRWLMGEALTLAWREDITRVWVHTCTLDHPSALGFYQAQGFVPFLREIETFPDPRLTGHLPADAAPQVAILS